MDWILMVNKIKSSKKSIPLHGDQLFFKRQLKFNHNFDKLYIFLIGQIKSWSLWWTWILVLMAIQIQFQFFWKYIHIIDMGIKIKWLHMDDFYFYFLTLNYIFKFYNLERQNLFQSFTTKWKFFYWSGLDLNPFNEKNLIFKT